MTEDNTDEQPNQPRPAEQPETFKQKLWPTIIGIAAIIAMAWHGPNLIPRSQPDMTYNSRPLARSEINKRERDGLYAIGYRVGGVDPVSEYAAVDEKELGAMVRFAQRKATLQLKDIEGATQLDRVRLEAKILGTYSRDDGFIPSTAIYNSGALPSRIRAPVGE